LKGAILKNGICTFGIAPKRVEQKLVCCNIPSKKTKEIWAGVYIISMSCIVKSSLCFLGKVLKAKCTKAKWSYKAFCYQISKKTIEIARFLMLRFQCITKNIPRRMLLSVDDNDFYSSPKRKLYR
jgi:hypothetical protein